MRSIAPRTTLLDALRENLVNVVSRTAGGGYSKDA